MRTAGVLVLCVILLAGHGAPVEKRRESTKEILELESLLKKSAGEDKKVFPSQLQKEAKEKEAKLVADADTRNKDDGIDIPPIPPEMQVDGLAEQDELAAQLEQQQMQEQEEEPEQETEELKGDDKEDETTLGEKKEETDTETGQTGEMDEEELEDEVEKREQEVFMKYLRESPELWQQLMNSLDYGDDDSEWNQQQERYTNPEDEYPAVMQEWRAAADRNNAQNYMPQYNYPQQYYPDLTESEESIKDTFVPDMSQVELSEDEELENELPQIPREFNNLEDLQTYYNGKMASEVAKKRGYGRPDWVDAGNEVIAGEEGAGVVQGNEAVESETADNTVQELEDMKTNSENEHTAQKRSPIDDHFVM